MFAGLSAPSGEEFGGGSGGPGGPSDPGGLVFFVEGYENSAKSSKCHQ